MLQIWNGWRSRLSQSTGTVWSFSCSISVSQCTLTID